MKQKTQQSYGRLVPKLLKWPNLQTVVAANFLVIIIWRKTKQIPFHFMCGQFSLSSTQAMDLDKQWDGGIKFIRIFIFNMAAPIGKRKHRSF